MSCVLIWCFDIDGSLGIDLDLSLVELESGKALWQLQIMTRCALLAK